jgi:fermentation-respiration switch protein FrsA (DUF1100 family)
MAAESDCRALILFAPFTSVTNMAARRFPLLPARFLLFDRFDNIAKIGALRAPLLIVHGDADPVIPLSEGQSLFAAAAEPKTFLRLPGASHALTMDPAVAAIESLLAR